MAKTLAQHKPHQEISVESQQEWPLNSIEDLSSNFSIVDYEQVFAL